MNEYLKQFQEMEHHREAVKAFMYAYLDDGALKAVYAGENVSGYKEARATLKGVFSRLEELYGEKDKPLSGNKAR